MTRLKRWAEHPAVLTTIFLAASAFTWAALSADDRAAAMRNRWVPTLLGSTAPLDFPVLLGPSAPLRLTIPHVVRTGHAFGMCITVPAGYRVDVGSSEVRDRDGRPVRLGARALTLVGRPAPGVAMARWHPPRDGDRWCGLVDNTRASRAVAAIEFVAADTVTVVGTTAVARNEVVGMGPPARGPERRSR